MAINIIKKGYRVTVHSWENDGDYREINTLDGLSRDEMMFVADLLAPFRESSWKDETKYIGNMVDFRDGYDTYDTIMRRLAKIAMDHPKVFEIGNDEDEDDPELVLGQEVWETYCFDLGLVGSDENRLTRIADRIIVEYVPEDVTFKEVTSEFIK